jgi:beta-lactamase regulating signal transducer with metallopeptidase domain
MNGTPLEALAAWVVDVYLLSTVLLTLLAVPSMRLGQPARRLAVARATSAGLIVLIVLTAIPGWPRLSWRIARSDAPRSLPPASDRRPEFLAAGPGGAVPSPVATPKIASRPTAARPDNERASDGPSPSVALPDDSHAARPTFPVVATLAYLAGSLLAAAWLGLGAILAARLVCGSGQAPPAFQDWLGEELARHRPIVRIRLADRIGQPVAVGLLRPAIVLPADLASIASNQALSAALRHEAAHIRNGDLVHLAVLRLLLPVLYLHPLYWWMRRRVRLDQELLADGAASGPNRTAYAETLLNWARSTVGPRREQWAGALALIKRPSELHRRIAALLDPRWNPEARCPRIWRISAWGLILVAALGLSFGTLRPGVVAAASAPDAVKTESQAADAIVFRGRVVDPDGRPFSGARLYLNYYRWEAQDRHQPVRATSDREGRFRFAVARTDFDRPHIEPWQNARVVAFADGYAPSGSDSEAYDHDRELTVRLARDDVPVTGRLVDLEGRPIAGATIRVASISTAPGGDLAPWIAAVAAREGTLNDLAFRYLKDIRAPQSDRLPEMPPVTTTPDGRFMIRGIGRERLADLIVEGPTIRTLEASVMTRKGESVRVPMFGRRKDEWFKVYHAARLELTAPPSRPIEGIVRDRDTGAPIPGVTIRSDRLADLDLVNNQLIKTKTDASGRFRLTGMPLGKGNEVVIAPPEDQPYLASHRKLDELTAAGPLRVEFVLKRGVWVEGKVTDKATGKPAFCMFRYAAAKDNPYLAEAPGFGDLFWNGDYSDITEARPDGTYRIAALPGRGILAAHTDFTIYPSVESLSGSTPDTNDFVPHIYQGTPFAEVSIEPGRPAPRCDLALVPARQVEAIVLDPEGRPLADAYVSGQWPHYGWFRPLESAQFTVWGLTAPKPLTLAGMFKARDLDAMASMVMPEKPRFLLGQHDGRKLAGWSMVTAETKGPVQIRLQPWATVSGRLLDRAGDPRPHYVLRPHVVDRLRLRDGWIEHRPDRITTDGAGRFRIEGLVPGLRYRLTLENADGVNTLRGTEIAPLRPGEDRNLGDVTAIVPGESD